MVNIVSSLYAIFAISNDNDVVKINITLSPISNEHKSVFISIVNSISKFSPRPVNHDT